MKTGANHILKNLNRNRRLLDPQRSQTIGYEVRGMYTIQPKNC